MNFLYRLASTVAIVCVSTVSAFAGFELDHAMSPTMLEKGDKKTIRVALYASGEKRKAALVRGRWGDRSPDLLSTMIRPSNIRYILWHPGETEMAVFDYNDDATEGMSFMVITEGFLPGWISVDINAWDLIEAVESYGGGGAEENDEKWMLSVQIPIHTIDNASGTIVLEGAYLYSQTMVIYLSEGEIVWGGLSIVGPPTGTE